MDIKPYELKDSVNIPCNTSTVHASIRIQWPDYFELNGKRYKNEGILSDSSKEAIIFTVTCDDKKYALKIYHYDPDYRPDHGVIEKIRLLSGSGLLVPVIEHGQLETPNLPGKKNDYQLMAFCEGGSLEDVVMAGDEKTLTEVAVKIGTAIDFLYRRGIIYPDIKPANFFYLDKERTQIVLSGFSSSGKYEQDRYVKIDDIGNSVYSAPEFYTKVPGEPPGVRVESHYFSLGMALLSLWMGKDWFISNERQLLQSKLTETLPMPEDMPEHMQSLIKSLTRLNLSDRADFDDIKRWVKGEDITYDSTLPVNSEFHIDFNSVKSQIAHSPAELAHYLLEDRVLGKKYLYSGKITRWLEEINLNDIAANVEKISTDIYPGNQEAGLLSVAFMLDPSIDYITPRGVHLIEPKDVAKYAYGNIEEMKDEVLGIDSNLKIFFKVHNLENTLGQADKFYRNRSDLVREDINVYIAIYCFAERLVDLPLPVYLDGHFEYAETVDDLFRLIRTEGLISDINEAIIQSPGFILWLEYKNSVLADKIRKLIDSDTFDEKSIYYNSSSAYRILYELDPDVDFKFNNDVNSPDRVYTVEEIGKDMEHLLIKFQSAKQDAMSPIGIFTDLGNTPYGDYLRARGEAYFNFLAWNQYCMDVNDESNEGKYGPYDTVIGIYKSVSGFLGRAPRYWLLERIIDSPEELKRFPAHVVAKALGDEHRVLYSQDGEPLPWLAAWLTVFFQENPRLNLSSKLTYENETVKYTEFIDSIDPDYYYAERYRKAEKKINKYRTRLEKRIRRINNRRILFCVLAGLPTVAFMVLSQIFERPDFYLIDWHSWIVFLLCFLGIGIPKILKGHSYSSVKRLVLGWLGRFFGTFALGCFVLIGNLFYPSIMNYIEGVALILLAAKYGDNILDMKDMDDVYGKGISAYMLEVPYIAVLYFAYNYDEKDVDGAIHQYLYTQIPSDENILRKINRYGWLWLLDVLFICALWVIFHPRFLL